MRRPRSSAATVVSATCWPQEDESSIAEFDSGFIGARDDSSPMLGAAPMSNVGQSREVKEKTKKLELNNIIREFAGDLDLGYSQAGGFGGANGYYKNGTLTPSHHVSASSDISAVRKPPLSTIGTSGKSRFRRWTTSSPHCAYP